MARARVKAVITMFVAAAAIVVMGSPALASGSVSVFQSPASVRAGHLITVQYKVGRDAYCQVRAHQGTHYATGPTWKVTKRLAAVTWRMPQHARSGLWYITFRCGGTKTGATKATYGRAVAHVRVRGERPGVVRFPSTVKLTQSRLKDPGVSDGLGAGSYPAFGTVLVSGSNWLNGQGVNVYSNGTLGCYQSCTSTTPYGIAYQCVELVNRLIVSKGWSPRVYGDAKYFFSNASGTYFDKHANGSGYMPVPGDIIVWSDSSFGHVGVVSWVANGRIGWVEQNASTNGQNSTTISGSGGMPSYPYVPSLTPVGFLHAKANHFSTGTTAGVNPDGHLDSATRSGSSVRLVGWAHDGDNDPAAVTVHALIDGNDAGSGLANISRSDVGQHGFDFLAPIDGSAHTVCAKAVNIGGGSDVTLSGCVSVGATSSGAPTSQVHHITADYVHINTCAGPSSSCPSVRVAMTGDEVDVVCQVRGGSYGTASGAANMWDNLTDGSYAPDYWVDTNNTVFNGFDSSLPQCDTSTAPSYQVHHITADYVHINTCAGPSTSCSTAWTAMTGDEVDVVCQTSGGSYSTASGTANVWDKLTDGNYAPDYWVDTKNTVFNGFDSSLPRC